MPGRLVEEAPTAEIFQQPLHPYTAHLVASLPRIGDGVAQESLSGAPPNLADPPRGCRFHPRCPLAMDICREAIAGADHARPRPSRRLLRGEPAGEAERAGRRAAGAAGKAAGEAGSVSDGLLERRARHQELRRGRPFRRGHFNAVNDVSFAIQAARPEILAIIGESGSGKTTLARMILNIVAPTSGTIRFRGEDLGRGPRAARSASTSCARCSRSCRTPTRHSTR